MNIVFDLDGTLIDSSERMYTLFQELIPESSFTKKDYWKLKRNKVNHKMILEKYYSSHDFDDFNKEWLEKIETTEFLLLDHNYPDTINTLEYLYEFYDLILLTARQSRPQLMEELERLELTRYFKVILVTEAKLTKKDLLFEEERKSIARTNEDLFICDMGSDVVIGKKLGYRTIGVTYGFMNKKNLLKYEPEFTIDSLKEIISIIRDKE